MLRKNVSHLLSQFGWGVNNDLLALLIVGALFAGTCALVGAL